MGEVLSRERFTVGRGTKWGDTYCWERPNVGEVHSVERYKVGRGKHRV